MCVCESTYIEGGGVEKVDLWVVWRLVLFLGLFWCWVFVVFEGGWFVVYCGCLG